MPAITKERLKGNYGAAAVMERLSAEALVRPVAADTDVGVDLYCETVVDYKPHLHFWLQVKAGEQCTRRSEGSASCCFSVDHLKYWEKQPVPVFAALVPTDWPLTDVPDVYIVDITTQLLSGPPNSRAKTITLHSDHHWPRGNRECVTEFLSEVVPDSTAQLQCSRGVVAPRPTFIPNYVRRIPAVPIARFKKEILDQLRVTAAYSVLFLDSQVEPADDAEFRRQCARIVQQFKNEHWEDFMARAQSSHADQAFDDAIGLYKKAQDTIRNDPKVCDLPEFQRYIKEIEDLKVCAQNHQPLKEAIFSYRFGSPPTGFGWPPVH